MHNARHLNSVQDSPRQLNNISTGVENEQARLEDTYEIQPDLTSEQLRVLFKIINKQLPDCGRKRGAILRYIRAYMPEPQPNYGSKILQRLKNL
jgi:hypothetical protein